MLFNSLQFLVFFPVVVIVYFLIPSKIRYLWLLACSYYFYMCWNPKYVLLLLASTAVTYLAGLFLERWSDSPKRKKWVLAICLLINFGILFVFKYANFAIQTIEKLLGLVHITVPEVTIRLLLPVGNGGDPAAARSVLLYFPGRKLSDRRLPGRHQAGEELLHLCFVCLFLPTAGRRTH